MTVSSLNQVYLKPSMRRRYEVWFLKLQLADGSGAWWFRYLLMNLGRGGCSAEPGGMPVQVWATWFGRDERPQSFIQGFSTEGLSLGEPQSRPFHLGIGDNHIGEDSCRGRLAVDGHTINWYLQYRSTFGTTMSDVGWIGFSRTPHSDAVFSGYVDFDGRLFEGEPLGWGLQGHNCGYRHRNRWSWMHAFARNEAGRSTALEALEYEIGFGLRFRRAILYHEGACYTFSRFKDEYRDRESLQWRFKCIDPASGLAVEVAIDGSGPSAHRLPYVKTDCSGMFEVSNNSLAAATLCLSRAGHAGEHISSNAGAVIEMAGD